MTEANPADDYAQFALSQRHPPRRPAVRGRAPGAGCRDASRSGALRSGAADGPRPTRRSAVTEGGSADRVLSGSTRPLSQLYDVGLLDLDGVVYVGPNPVQGAAEALASARAAGMRLAFVTNNASRDPATVAAHLVQLGIPASPDDVVIVLPGGRDCDRGPSRARRVGACHRECGYCGPPLETAPVVFWEVRRRRGSRTPRRARVFGTGVVLTDLAKAEAALAVRAGALWVATNASTAHCRARAVCCQGMGRWLAWSR